MKKIILLFSVFSFLLFSTASVFAQDFHLKAPERSIELSFQDFPEAGAYSGEAQELDTGSYESRGERNTVVVVGIIAGVLAIAGVVVPLVIFN